MTQQLTLDRDALEPRDFENVDDELELIGAGWSGNNWWTEANRQLAAIAQLPAGWDSHGGDPPQPKILHGARSLLRSLLIADATLAKPHIHPTPSGGVQFHWEYGQRYFEIEFVDEYSAQFYYADRADNTEFDGEMEVGDSLWTVVELARKVGTEP